MSTKILVTSEIATGVINGVNKSFTVSKLISSINTIIVNQTEYAQYSFLGTTILLDDAPTTGPVLVTYSYESDYDFLDNSNWIPGEIMQGTVNSSNKVFTAFYPISLIDEVRVNGVPVSGYTVMGNSILFAAAPTNGYVEIDYFRQGVSVRDNQRDIYFTKKEIRDMVYAEIGQDETSVQYPRLLVDAAISDGVTELITEVTDKSRNVPFYITSPGIISAIKIDNSINTLQLSETSSIPPVGRILSALTGNMIDYNSISSSYIMSISTLSGPVDDSGLYFIGYRLPKNIKRVTCVTINGYRIQDAGNISDFIYSAGGYLITNGYIYLGTKGTAIIECEIDNYKFGDDNSFVFVDREDVGVIVYYALRQLYQSRESDKLQSTSQIFLDKLRSYKRRMNKKRSNNKFKLIKTSYGLIP